MSAAVVLLYFGLRPFAGRTFAAFVPLLIAVAIRVPLSEGNFTEEYAVFLQAAAVFCLVRLEDSRCRRPDLYALMVGLAGACAFFLRANLIGMWVTLGLYWLVKAALDKDFRGLVKNCGWALAPVILMTAALVIYFHRQGALPDFLEAFIFHNIRYSQDVSMPLWSKTARMLALGQRLYPFLPGCVVDCIMLLHGWWKKRYPLILVFVPVWLVVEVVLSSLSGYLHPHYLITWQIPMAGLVVLAMYRAAIWLTGCRQEPSTKCMVVLSIVAAGALATTIPAFGRAAEPLESR